MSDRDEQFSETEHQPGPEEEFFFGSAGEAQADSVAAAEESSDIAGGGLGGGQVRVVDPPGGGTKRRLLLLLLLAVALGGGAFMLLEEQLLGPAPTPPQPMRQPQKIQVPVRKPAVTEVVMPSKQVAAVATEKPQPASTPAPVKPAQPVAKAKPLPAPKPVTKVKPSPVPQPVTKAKPSPYGLQVGAFIVKGNLNQTLKKIKGLGYQPAVIEGRKTVTMTRLRVGVYSPAMAKAKLKKLREEIDSAFIMAEGKKLAVYAGSFYVLDRARVHADRLYTKGIRVEEVPVEVEVPISSIRFGGFADRQAAQKASEQVRQLGLDVLVVKQN